MRRVLQFILPAICCCAFFVHVASAAEPVAPLADYPGLSIESDWPWWRGPSRNGIASDSAVPPTTWSETSNVVWKSPVPGRGHSSPIVVGKKLYLTTAEATTLAQSVLAFDRATGKPLWQTPVSRGGFPEHNHPKNTEATSTLACDGERLFATFFHHQTIQVTALDLDGKIIWQKVAGPFNPKKYEYGYAPSPLLYGPAVIVSAEYDAGSYLVALDRIDGAELWRTPRPKNISFSSPVVAPVAGRDQLLISGGDRVASFDPSNGKELWSQPGTTTATCGTAVWDGDLIFASGGYPDSQTLAIRAVGKGKVVWHNKQRCYEQSLMAHDGHLYALNGNGILFCWRATDGHEMWKKRLTGPVSASPVLANGHIYWANEKGTMYVFKANPKKLEMVAENQLGEEGFPSPAVCGPHFFLRTASSSATGRQEFLYCLGGK